MKKNKVIDLVEEDYLFLAKNTRNFTGAEIESLVKSATSWAFRELTDLMDF